MRKILKAVGTFVAPGVAQAIDAGLELKKRQKKRRESMEQQFDPNSPMVPGTGQTEDEMMASALGGEREKSALLDALADEIGIYNAARAEGGMSDVGLTTMPSAQTPQLENLGFGGRITERKRRQISTRPGQVRRLG